MFYFIYLFIYLFYHIHIGQVKTRKKLPPSASPLGPVAAVAVVRAWWVIPRLHWGGATSPWAHLWLWRLRATVSHPQPAAGKCPHLLLACTVAAETGEEPCSL